MPVCSVRQSVCSHCVRCISPILFESGIPNLVCGAAWDTECHFGVTVTLNSDFVSRVICPEHISCIILGSNPSMHLGKTACCIHILSHCNLDTSDLIFSGLFLFPTNDNFLISKQAIFFLNFQFKPFLWGSMEVPH